MSIYLPFMTMRKERDHLLYLAEICWCSETLRSPDAEQAMWVWLLRWAGAPA